MESAIATDKAFMKGSIEIKRKPTKKEPNPEIRIYRRDKPLFYRLKFPSYIVSVPGHYESECGGCDNIPTYEMLFNIIRSEHAVGHHVLFEGLLVAHDVKQCTALWEWLQRKPGSFKIIELTESLDTCLASVEGRRASRKNPPKQPFKPENTIRRYGEVIRSCEQLAELGIPILKCNRDEALEMLKREFQSELVLT